ncbi:hypothetical protein QWJ34_15645 [Saccharibacillus sp. CPCC 101409]|uniref:DUF6602 domain-containing protein n=1 Tax=Saccharibacillus sp. CPCC 101409 TaxID=3058041 RepID=UPI0026713612|nr:DUF6602 domain-containing protein [Saccharibacillus sp. CPCC 101409]MDO3411199.1 hypothetical protein [Saccharibacillus sp. CPCC 101409]
MAQDKKVFKRIKENYRYLNQMMVEEIDIASEHGGISGNYREEMWIKFFRSIIPMKYSMAQGVIIIDSEQNRSREVDIAVYDEAYTPYVFQYNTLKFIPIEAVAVAIECKSSSWKEKSLKKWASEIRKLKPKASGIARIVTGYATGITNATQQRSRPILILASNLSRKDAGSLENIKEKLGDSFDFILLKKEEEGQHSFELFVKHENKKLGWWGKRLNELEGVEKPEITEDHSLRVIPQHLSKTIWNHTKEEQIQKHKNQLSKRYPEVSFELIKNEIVNSDNPANPKIEHDIAITNTLANLKIENNPLLTLNFQLNQLLMLINNPMLFPHFAYAKAFKEIAQEKE